MEIKSIGDHPVIPDKADQVTEVSDDSIRKRVRDVVQGHRCSPGAEMQSRVRDEVQGQMQKSEAVLRHMLSDLYEKVEDIRIIKVMAMPYLKRSRLRNAVEADADLAKDFCSCLIDRPEGPLTEAVNHCLCEEEVVSPRNLCERATGRLDETSDEDDELKSWWINLTKRQAPNEHEFQSTRDLSSNVMSDDLYIQIVSRFCGMYSTVEVDTRKGHRDEVRTVDECIHLTGVRFGRNVLFPAQKMILDRQDRFLCLTGTPGSGKTLILALKAVEWVKHGHVIIVCLEGVEYGTLVSLTLRDQVAKMAQGDHENVHAQRVCLETNVEDFVDTLLRKNEGARLGIILDEIPREVSKHRQQEKLQQSVDSLRTAFNLFRNILSSSSCQLLDAPPESQAPADSQSQSLNEIKKSIDFLEKRLKHFYVGQSENFLPILDAEWVKSLEEIQALGEEGKAMLKSLTIPGRQMDRAEVILQDVCVHMHSALGSLYNFYNCLYFVVVHKLMEVLAKKHKENNADVCVWTSCLFDFQPPKPYERAALDLCVRCPPAIQTLLELLDEDLHEKEEKSTFTYLNILGVHNPPLPSTGCQIKLLDHSDHVIQVTEVSDCRECGRALLTYLVDILRVGTDGKGPLRPHDVVISGSPVYANRDCEFLRELRKTFGIKLENRELEGHPPYQDNIFVTGGSVLQGLESKIVVNVPKVKYILAREGEGIKDQNQRADLPDWLQNLGTWNRRQLWFVASRALSHLIVFVCAPR